MDDRRGGGGIVIRLVRRERASRKVAILAPVLALLAAVVLNLILV